MRNETKSPAGKAESERGAVMLEGMIVVIITMLLLVWILGVGFLYYQRYLVTALTNDAAAKVAATYNNPDSDIIMGYIAADHLTQRDLYRGFKSNSFAEANQDKAESYVKYMLDRTNFAGTISEVEVTATLVRDSQLRKHVEVHTVCYFNTPFSQALTFFGMEGHAGYEATGRADCTDVIDYISSVDFARYAGDGLGQSGPIIKMINSLVKVFNHKYVKS